MPRLRLLAALLAALIPVAVAPSVATADASIASAKLRNAPDLAHVEYPGLQKLHYKYGPIQITPGQNTIELRPNNLKPSVPGYITRFKPNLIYTNGKVPPVDVVHLHHGVWLVDNYPTYAAGEEKTIFQLPRGFGMKYEPNQKWALNYMLHNLLPNRTQVYITWDIDFLPADAAAAQGITEAKQLWMDVSGPSFYPVFDAKKGWGEKGRFTFPDDAPASERSKAGPWGQQSLGRDITLIGAGGHLHPGGLHDDLFVQRNGASKRIFRSQAKYFEPAGAVSWDVALTVTKPDWRIAVRKGESLRISSTYDTRKASWYESMGIVNVWYAEGILPGAKDPFAQKVNWKAGTVTHGHLAENNNHGGTQVVLPDVRQMISGFRTSAIDIKDFIYARGDLSLTGKAGRPPTVKQGGSLTFRNLDSPQGGDATNAIYHTITACKAPCNKQTGVAYPIANGNVDFDSGELGYGPRFMTAAANRATWQTPRNLKAGTYTYFCRVHPFMRGSFRVVAR
jgi:hypothetical protein